MKYLKRFIIAFVLLDNWLTNFSRRLVARSKWKLAGKCKQCGVCCEEIYLKITPAQLASKFFGKLAIAWVCWLFDFIYLRTDFTGYYIVFTCKHRLPSGSCGNYFWRPNVCRNYPLVDYFNEPKFIPGCGFKAVES